MAIEVFPDSPNLVISPRISFSHDLSPNNIVPIEQYLLSNNPSIDFDFDFCVFNKRSGQDSTSADELFSDGKILPIQIKKPKPPPPPRAKTSPPPPLPPPARKHTVPNFETRKPISESEEKHITKSSLWGFKRSTNGGSGYGRGFFPFPLLSRSNSTGSNDNTKRTSNMKQSLLRSSSCSHQKPPLKKNNQASYCYGVRIHPVLNVPPANLFGLGSIFSYNGTNKSKKK